MLSLQLSSIAIKYTDAILLEPCSKRNVCSSHYWYQANRPFAHPHCRITCSIIIGSTTLIARNGRPNTQQALIEIFPIPHSYTGITRPAQIPATCRRSWIPSRFISQILCSYWCWCRRRSECVVGKRSRQSAACLGVFFWVKGKDAVAYICAVPTARM